MEHANNAVLAEGQRVLIEDPHRFDGVAVIQWRPAASAKAPEATIADELTVRQARVRFNVTNPAKGRDAQIVVTARFRDTDGRDLVFDEHRDASERDVSHEFSMQLNQPLRRLSAWSVLFKSDAILFRDWKAHLSDFTIELDLEDDAHQASNLPVDIPSEIALDLDNRRYFGRGVPEPRRKNPATELEVDFNLARFLTDLNANRAAASSSFNAIPSHVSSTSRPGRHRPLQDRHR